MTKENKSVRQKQASMTQRVFSMTNSRFCLNFLGVKRHFLAMPRSFATFSLFSLQGRKFTKWHKFSKT